MIKIIIIIINLCVHFTINCGKTIKILFFVFVSVLLSNTNQSILYEDRYTTVTSIKSILTIKKIIMDSLEQMQKLSKLIMITLI